MSMRRKSVLTLSAIVAATMSIVSSASIGRAEDEGVSITFKNSSQWEIHHLFLSPTKSQEWGADQLGEKDDDVIKPGKSFELKQIPVGKYDVKIVDEDKDECIVAGVKIAANETVDLTDKDMVGCQQKTEEAGEK